MPTVVKKRFSGDTICAISTPLGTAGIGIIRISGSRSYPILNRFFRNKKGQPVQVSQLPSHSVHYGFIVSAEEVKDEVLLTIMRAPASYTRQDMAEIGCHGGLVPLKSVLETLLAAGCRLAEPGEFTKLAFLSGRIDLIQAEAVLATIGSKTETALSGALNQLRGGLSRKFSQIEKELAEIRAEIEAQIEFPEETFLEKENKTGYEKLVALRTETERLLKYASFGRILSEGLKVAILGRPNVGKSSLLNSLLSEERAIVTAIPGTTRDEVSEMLTISGFPLKIIDTAGIRLPRDEIEEAGIQRSRRWINAADLTLLVLDRSTALTGEDKELLAVVSTAKTILVLNKSDLTDRLSPALSLSNPLVHFTTVEVSCLTGEGIMELEETISRFITEGRVCDSSPDPIFLGLKQREKLEAMVKDLRKAEVGLKKGLPLELVASTLRQAAEAAAEITGNDVNETVLNEIFSRFCIGK